MTNTTSQSLMEQLEAHAAQCRQGKAGPWEGANLRGANLEGVDLRYADLGGANLEGANLEGANLGRANLEGANLWGANLRYAHLRYAHLRGANLGRANLEGADLWGANLEGANLWGANLWGHKVASSLRTHHLRYWAASFETTDGVLILRYGCECLPVTEWRENLWALCIKHEPDDADSYEYEIGALLDLVEVAVH